MTTDDNKAVIRRMFAALDAHDLDLIEQELVDPGYHLHFDSMPRATASAAA